MKSADYLSRLNSLSIAAHNLSHSSRLLTLACQESIKILQCTACAIYLRNKRTTALAAFKGNKLGGAGSLGIVPPLVLKVIRGKKPYALDRSMCAPLLSGSKVFGAIYVVNKSRAPVDHIHVLRAIAVQVGLNWQRLHQSRHLQHRLGQSERLASLGKLAGGIAHEFNNPLDGIMRYTNLSLQLLGEDQPVVREYLLEVKQGLKRMSSIVQSLLACARNNPPSKQKINLNQAVEAAVKDLGPYLIHKSVILHKHLGEKIPPVVDRGLDRIIFNLLRNAVDAIDKGGQIEVHTGTAKHGVFLQVKDNGKGIDPQHLNRIFEPFFSTKKIEQGCGLGLTIVSEIIKSYNGKIDVKSKPQEGTVFTVALPIKGK